MLKLNKKIKMIGQSTAEYAILIGVVVAAAVGMQTYIKRGVQARVHDEAVVYYDTAFRNNNDWDDIRTDLSSQITVSGITAGQYEPESLSSKSTQQTVSDTQKSHYGAGGTVSRESDRTTQQASEDYQKYDY